MRNGFTFKNRHLSEFNVTVKTKSRPIRPSAKSFTLDMPCRDGVYDFSEFNPHNREHYYDRIFTVTLSVISDDLYEMQNELSKLSLWLTGSGELIFDDMPVVVWNGRITDEILYMPEHNGRKAVIEVSFRVEPFSDCIFGMDGPCIGMSVMIGDNIPLVFEDNFIYEVSGSGDLNIVNFGDCPMNPVISINGNAVGILLSMGDRRLSFTTSGDTIVDFEKQNVTNTKGEVSISGEFFEIPSGNSILHIENSNKDKLIINVEYKAKYMYNAHFDGVKWGEVNA